MRIGLIGCGVVAQAVHLRLLAGLGAQVIALADPDEMTLRAAGALAPQAVRLASAHALLERDDLQAVLVAAPTAQHASLAGAALARGIPVYLEKPLAQSRAHALSLVESPGAFLMLGLNLRFHPLLRDLRTRLQAGQIGEAVTIRSVFCSGRPTSGWRQSRQSGGGVLLDLGSHHLDLLHYLTGSEAESVCARLRSLEYEQDTADVTVVLRNGTVCQCFFSQASADAERLEVHGTRGSLSVNRYLSVEVEQQPRLGDGALRRRLLQMLRSPRHFRYLWGKQRAPYHEPSYAPCLASFLDSVRAGRLLEGAGLRDGLRTLEWVEAAERSAREGSVPTLL